MPTFPDAQNANAAFSPSYVPVMVVTGATAGIGKAMIEAFARHLHGRVHIVLIGRDRAAAEAIIAGLPTSPESKYEFISCNVLLMKNIHALTKDLSERLPKINFLVHCAGFVRLGGRKETEEVLDDLLVIRYYNRFALTNDLLPLLRNATAKGEAASVLCVLGAGLSPEVDLDDLGLKKNYALMKALTQSSSYNDLMVAEFARLEPEIAFTHIHPGFVFNGTMFGPSSLTTKVLSFVFRPLLWLLTIPQEENAEYMLYALLAAQKGMNRRDKKADDIGLKKFPQAKDAQKILYQHSLEETTVAEQDS
ncbi:hypothetical protein BDZ97DRAFT_1660167 [Flammula alnicola]|nr:hypothetical protein BDZ97DRAFT_1660167 [Flammula alnicola]